MGDWGTGPFDGDVAADFAQEIDSAAPQERVGLLEARLQRVVDTRDHIDLGDTEEAVAAAALVAAQTAGSEVVIDPVYGPSEPLPELPAALRALAGEALECVLGHGCEMHQNWMSGEDAAEWRRGVERLLGALQS